VRRQYEARAMELSNYRREIREQKLQQDAEADKLSTCKSSLVEREKELIDKKVELQKLGEQLALSKRQVEKQVVQLQERAAGSSSSREAELDRELKQAMSVLKCSACKGAQFRDTVITKCGHTFCKPCVDARISTRQRKCPACNSAFGTGEVLPIFMQ